ncbi:hypothetical protein BH20ACT4_BH20ACT4_12950 [soil metagenome]
MDLANDAHDARRQLKIYLQDHHAGSAAGVTLAKRLQKSHAGTDRQPVIDGLVRQIDEDREKLRGIMKRLEVRPSVVKQGLATAATLAGGLKPNGALRGPTPLGRHVELESLLAGVAIKRSLWESLRAAQHPALESAELDSLVDRATAQLDTVRDLRDATARETFGAA